MRVQHDQQPYILALNVPRRALLALACLLLGVGPAAAAVYYVSPAGSGSACTESQPCALSSVNPRVVAGDVVRLAAGTYTGDGIAPAGSGASYRPGGMITYVGSIANPAGTVVPSLVLRNEYASVKGVTISTTADSILGSAHDSLSSCRITADWSRITGGMDNVMANCTMFSEHFFFTGTGPGDTTLMATRDTLVDCTFNLSPTSGGSHTMSWRGLDGCVLNRCRFNITVGSGVSGGGITKMFWVRNLRITDSRWEATNNSMSCDECGWFVMRDQTRNNTFVRDTFFIDGPGQVQFYASNTGNAGSERGVFGDTYDHCYWRVPTTNTVTGVAVFYNDAALNDTWRNCVVVSGGGALAFNGVLGGLTMDHCTLVGFAPRGGVWDASDPSDRFPWWGTSTITNNVFCSLSSQRAVRYAPLSLISSYAAGHLTGNYNLFYSAMGVDTSISMGGNAMSAPGTGKPWYLATGDDGQSVYGDPKFANTASVASFDPHLLTGSRAIGKGGNATDIGAFPFDAGGGDLTPPGVVSDLATAFVASTNLTLRWTAPGDDGMSGVPAAYDVRWSNQPITVANFSDATPVTPQPAPAPGGTVQTYVALSLTPGTTYYYAMRAVDEAGNWSGMSNVAVATTPATDQVRPGPINDLRAP
jgi:hypothetical protein